MITVVITESVYTKGKEVFDQTQGVTFVPVADDESSLSRALRETGARYAIIGHSPYVDELYRTMPAGGILARFGAGHDGVNKAKATAAGIFCTNTPGTLAESVAEHTITLLLAFARNLVPMANAMSRDEWAPQLGREIHGSRLVVLGVGEIGLRVAMIAADGFGMSVVVCGRPESHQPAMLEAHGIAFTRHIDDALPQAEFLSVHIPGVKENTHFLDHRRLSLLPPNACVINTSRGSVIDENALYDLLADSTIAGAALDVFTIEPYVPLDSARDLHTLPNVLLTPHTGSNTPTAVRQMAESSIRNVRAAEAGAFEEMNLLNPQVLERSI